jgi:hypothetical protein
MHWPLHMRLSPPQTQAPCEQLSPPGQMTPTHDRSWQVPSTQTDAASHAAPLQEVGKQAPFAQAVPDAQALLQLPQFRSSVFRLAQLAPHADNGAVQAVVAGGVLEQLSRTARPPEATSRSIASPTLLRGATHVPICRA